MGLLDKMMQKVGDTMEKTMGKNLSGESKEQYEKDKENKVSAKQEQDSLKEEAKMALAEHTVPADKTALKDLELLLIKNKTLNEQKNWVGGFDNFRTNQNAKFANILSGNKNVKTISIYGDQCFVCKYDGNNFLAVKQFSKSDVIRFEVEGLVGKKIKLELKDNYKLSIDVTENKEKVAILKNFFK